MKTNKPVETLIVGKKGRPNTPEVSRAINGNIISNAPQNEQARSRKVDGTSFREVTLNALKSKSNKRDNSSAEISLSDKIVCEELQAETRENDFEEIIGMIKNKTTGESYDGQIRFYYKPEDVKEAVKKLKEKVLWGKNHGNGDLNSTKAVLEDIDTVFGRRLSNG